MKRGLTQTLMTVAIALLGYQALALAPVITEIPSPVVGNAEASQSNLFVWPDAIALDSYVSDDATAVGSIKWYYRVEDPQHYMLNGVDRLSATEAATATDNAAALPEGKRIDSQVLQSEQNPDTNSRTVTIRNTYYSPFTGTGATPPAAGSPADMQIITLYASDGSAYSTKEVTVYSQTNANDHFGAGTTPFVTKTFNSTQEGFVYQGQIGSVTSSTSGATAICFNVTGLSYGLWVSPFGIFSIDQNSVYKIRANMNSSQATAGKTPFWDIYVDNFDNSAGDKGLNLFGSDLFILDNPAEGSANAVIQKTNGTDFQLWFNPIAVGTSSWDSNFSSISGTADNLKTHVTFRLLDVRTDLGSSSASGVLCLGEMDITKYPFSSFTKNGNDLYSVTNFKPNTGSGGNTQVTGLGGYMSTTDWTGGVLTLTPSSTSGGTGGIELTTISPATDTSYTLGTNDIADNFPVLWESNTLYRVQYTLAAPSSAAEANPFDAMYIGVDVPSNECLMETYVTNNGTNKLAMPKATAQTYTAFWWSHNVSTSANPYYNHFHPRLTVVNNTALNVGNNTGGMKISGCTVCKMNLPQ